MRWRIEHDYRELKTGLGLAHFEGRTFTGWHRRAPLSYETAAHLPKSSWGSLSLYSVLKELQRVLAIYLGYCTHCRQRAPT